MAVKLVFLGRLEDAAGVAHREVPASATLDAVLAALEPELRGVLTGDRVRIAVNGALVAGGQAVDLHDGDEIAFLPPVSGG